MRNGNHPLSWRNGFRACTPPPRPQVVQRCQRRSLPSLATTFLIMWIPLGFRVQILLALSLQLVALVSCIASRPIGFHGGYPRNGMQRNHGPCARVRGSGSVCVKLAGAAQPISPAGISSGGRPLPGDLAHHARERRLPHRCTAIRNPNHLPHADNLPRLRPTDLVRRRFEPEPVHAAPAE